MDFVEHLKSDIHVYRIFPREKVSQNTNTDFKCDTCLEFFRNEQNLREHYLSQTHIKRLDNSNQHKIIHQCVSCKNIFTRATSLKRHYVKYPDHKTITKVKRLNPSNDQTEVISLFCTFVNKNSTKYEF